MSTAAVVIIVAVVAVIIALSVRSGPKVTQITRRVETDEKRDGE